MLDLASATHEVFRAHLNEPFLVEIEGHDSVEIELISIETRGGFDPARQKRQAFSLLFRGAPELNLPQRIYSMTHETLGRMDLFLVPVGPDENGMRFEAVFT